MGPTHIYLSKWSLYFVNLIYLKESSITEAVEKQLQGAMQPQMLPPQPSVTPQMMKKPQMGTQATVQASLQHEQPMTPVSGK